MVLLSHAGVSRLGTYAKRIELKKGDRAVLEKWASGQKVEKRLSQRAKVILAASEGKPLHVIRTLSGLSEINAGKWRRRYVTQGLKGLEDAPRPGQPKRITPEQENRIVALACQRNLPNGKQRWSQADIAKQVGVSQDSVWRILSSRDLKPHKTQYWCGKSPDPEFEAKQAAIIGLYLNPPANALVLAVDEKTQIQALNRTQPQLPLRAGNERKLTSTYKRHGTTSLLAALEVHHGQINAQCVDTNNHQTFLAFLKHLRRLYPKQTLHIILDNLSVHKHKAIKNWLNTQPNMHVHFTPTYASWLNQIEIWFGILSRDVLKDGVWSSKQELIEQLLAYIQYYNSEKAKPFQWTYTGSPLKR